MPSVHSPPHSPILESHQKDDQKDSGPLRTRRKDSSPAHGRILSAPLFLPLASCYSNTVWLLRLTAVLVLPRETYHVPLVTLGHTTIPPPDIGSNIRQRPLNQHHPRVLTGLHGSQVLSRPGEPHQVSNSTDRDWSLSTTCRPI